MAARCPDAMREEVPAPKGDRILNWDRLRFLAFLDIASTHTHGLHAFGGVGLPMFLMLRFALGARRPTPLTASQMWRERALKLLLPWAVWSVAFALLNAAIALHHSGSWHRGVFEPLMLLYGPTQHLWFLPFAAVCGVAVAIADRVTRRFSSRSVIVASFLTGGLALAVICTGTFRTPTFPFYVWLFGLPSLPLGLALGRLLATSRRDRPAWSIVLGAAAVGLLAYALARRGGGPVQAIEPLLRYSIATALIAGAAMAPEFAERVTPALTPLLLGAYLLQFTVYTQTVLRIELRTGIRLGTGTALLASVPLTFVTVALLRRTRLKAVL